MPDASSVRKQIESSLALKIPSSLTPAIRSVRPLTSTGIERLDLLLSGGLPVGAVTELVGPECSGRTSVALSFLAEVARSGKVCAWIDVENTFDPAAAACVGLDLDRLLWVRCGVGTTEPSIRNTFTTPQKCFTAPVAKKGLHGGGFGPHPRTEVRGLSDAVGTLFPSDQVEQRCCTGFTGESDLNIVAQNRTSLSSKAVPAIISKPWSRIDQSLRAMDLILQGGGFGAIVLDMGGLAPEYSARIPLSTWYRYRIAAERTQSSILLLTQFPCAKSSAELVLQFAPGQPIDSRATTFNGLNITTRVERNRAPQPISVAGGARKPPQSCQTASLVVHPSWVGRR